MAVMAATPQVMVEQLRLGMIGVSDGHTHGGWAAIFRSACRT
jgi:hypothetical protein